MFGRKKKKTDIFYNETVIPEKLKKTEVTFNNKELEKTIPTNNSLLKDNTEAYGETITNDLKKTEIIFNQNFGSYRVISKIGQGSMGVVYLAHNEDGKEIALKLILNEALAKFEDRYTIIARFKRESKYAILLKHSNIVNTFDVGEIEGNLFLACEYVRGGSLDNLLKNKISPEVVVKLTLDVLMGLEEINKNNLVHRDIKTSNILIDTSGIAKVADLGLLRSTNSDRTFLTHTGSIMGTPLYMSPEQINGDKQIDIRTDLYAVGVMLYRCLYGNYPFISDSILDIAKKHLIDQVPEPKEKINEQLFKLIQKLMEKNPENRPSSCMETYETLHSIYSNLDYKKVINEITPLLIKHNTIDNSLSTVAMEQSQTIGINSEIEVDEGNNTFSNNRTILKQTILTPILIPSSSVSRAKIISQINQHKIFIYSKKSLQIGRNGIDNNGQDICLRPLPASENSDTICQISGSHMRIFIQNNECYIEDLGSSGGTKLNNKLLIANTPTKLLKENKVYVANVLELEIKIIPFISTTSSTIENVGVCENSPSIWITRCQNTSEHSYLLLAGKIGINFSDSGFKVSGSDEVDVLNVNGSLWIVNNSTGKNTVIPMSNDISYQQKGQTFFVRQINSNDQKNK